jgi:GT2 family glycosyltransferase
MTEPYALVVINWRTPKLTIAALRSAQKMAVDPAELRLILIDNHSSDDSIAIFTKELPEVELHKMPGNLGFAKAVNRGLNLGLSEIDGSWSNFHLSSMAPEETLVEIRS